MSYKPPTILTQNGKLQAELSIKDLDQRCRTCFVTNPMACREICDIWKLKQEYLGLKKEISEKPDASTVMATVTDHANMKILQVLSAGPSDLENLKAKLWSSKTTTEFGRSIEALLKAGLMHVEGERCYITPAGCKTLNTLEEYGPLELEKIDTLNEKVIRMLAQGVATIDELSKEIPRTELTKTIEQLRIYGMVTKTSGRNQVLYFATKRRPTRRLAPAEMAIFKTLPKQGISAQELSKKLDLTLPSVYRYLRLLRYKRHVVQRKQSETFELTSTGSQIADALKKVERAIQRFSPSDFA
jgi:DNA-binding transcriptional ArsR family regulator